MTRETPLEATREAAEAIRCLNHQTRSGAAQSDVVLDVVDVYDLLAELGLMSARLPQLLRQLEAHPRTASAFSAMTGQSLFTWVSRIWRTRRPPS